MITELRCAACDVTVPIAAAWPWRCPGAGESRHHVLRLVSDLSPLRPDDHANPLVSYRRASAWHAFATSRGMSDDATVALVERFDEQVRAVDGSGFHVTPFAREARLSERLGFSAPGGLWVKDETGNVAGSHKARHLAGIMLHLLAAESVGAAPAFERPVLAIASCGNAALAASTLAAAVEWPIEVFVPTSANPAVLARLATLGARVTTCERRFADPPGDPCVLRFREAVALGAIPFSVQGPENALCLDTGRTIGWEMLQWWEHDGPPAVLDRWYVQVGAGALAACVGRSASAAGLHPRLHAVQTEGCAPLARAWAAARRLGAREAARRWDECMWPWEDEPRSAATGILDDEAYDWIGVVDALATSGGDVVVAREADVLRANELARASTAIPVDHTGSAGLAGVLARRSELDDHEAVAVIFSGRAWTGAVGDQSPP